METFISWVRNILFAIIASTVIILFCNYILKNEMNILRIALFYIVLFIFANIWWLIKIKNIKFTRIKYSIFIGIFGLGITTATLANIIINNPFTFIMQLKIIFYLCWVVLYGELLHIQEIKKLKIEKTKENNEVKSIE
ncbi:MAG: hypothetical protein LBK73_15790 [Treponema sp.]|jgi:hypothetical protein|nr:hypothetical protein [Treponema sp.]